MSEKLSRRDFIKATGLFTTSALYLDASLWIEGWYNSSHFVKYEQRNLEVPRLPETADNTLILHLTDTHIDVSEEGVGLEGSLKPKDGDWIARLAHSKILENQPKRIVLIHTGDFVSSAAKFPRIGDLDTFLTPIQKLAELYNIEQIGILGNHDTHNPDLASAVREVLSAKGFILPTNEEEFEEIKLSCGVPVLISPDITTKRVSYKQNSQLVNRLLEDSIFRLMITHNPEAVSELEKSYANINNIFALAGHTHGGQFAENEGFLLNRILHHLILSRRIHHNSDYVAGYYPINEVSTLLVNTGLGNPQGDFIHTRTVIPEIQSILLKTSSSDKMNLTAPKTEFYKIPK